MQFANALTKSTSGNGKLIRKGQPADDILANTLVVLDEAHLWFTGGSDLPKAQQASKKGRTAFQKAMQATSTGKVLLMSATPCNKATIMFRLLNLMLPESDQLPTTNKEIATSQMMDSKTGALTPSGAKRIQKAAKGKVSYLNLLKDPSKFATVVRHRMDVELTTIQVEELEKCTTGKARAGRCMRWRLSFAGKKPPTYMLDHPQFNPTGLNSAIKLGAPRITSLISNIKKLNADDKRKHNRTFKHVIFSDLGYGYGSKLIASALAADGGFNFTIRTNSSKTALELNTARSGRKLNFAWLTTAGISKKSNGSRFSTTLQTKTRSESNPKVFMPPQSLNQKVLNVFNSHTSNSRGEMIDVLVLSRDFSVGINAYDIKYLHMFNPQVSESNRTQAEGRGTRFCGQSGLPFDPKAGWKLHVYNYVAAWPREVVHMDTSDLDTVKIEKPTAPSTLDKSKLPFELAKTLELSVDVKAGGVNDVLMANFTNQACNAVFEAAVDAGLNSAINGAILQVKLST